MRETESWVGASERVELLRHGIVVVAAEADGVAVTGVGLARVHQIAERVLDPQDVEVLGETLRRVEPRRCCGYMEREAGRLQVRFELRGDEHIDDIVVAEDEQTVVVFGTVCTAVGGQEGHRCEVPYHEYLRAPLGDRTVIDGTTGEAVPYKNIYAELERRRRG
jgi:hypothetical protein